AEVWGVAHRLLAPAEGAPRMTGAELRAIAERADPLLDFPRDERGLCKDLSRFYRGLALQAARDAPPRDAEIPLAELLLDRAYAVRPFALRHHRDTPWPGKKIRTWIRNSTSAQRGG
ncbi:serine/threonine protein kinase, partial [Streptomyces sp. NPDC005904]